jgi:hypothetical protein
MRKFDPESATIAIQLQQILSDLAHEIDFNNGLNIADFYVEDGTFAVGDFVHKGRAAIKNFYTARLQAVRTFHKDGTRVSCHTFVNQRISVHDKGNATVFFTNINYAGEGHPPVRGTIAPAMVTDCRMDFKYEADGQWRITSFSGKPLFIGDDPFTRQMLLKA